MIDRIERVVRRVATFGVAAVLVLVMAETVRAGSDPVISGVAISDTTLTIDGTDFGSAQGASVVRLAGIELDATSWSDTEIDATVPSGFRAGSHGVTVTRGGSTSPSFPFDLAPVVLDVTPGTAVAGDDVTVDGWFFGDDPEGDDAVLVGGVTNGVPVTATDANWTGTSVTITLPDLRAAETAIAIRVATLKSGEVPFTIQPTFTGIAPSSGQVRDIITLSGSGFGSSPMAGDSVFVNGALAFVDDWSTSAIDVFVPRDACSGFSRIRIGSQSVTTVASFSLDAPSSLNQGDLDVDGGEPFGGGSDGFGQGTTMTVTVDGDPGLAPFFRLDDGGTPYVLDVTENPLGTYVATWEVDGAAGDFPGDGDYDLLVTLDNGCDDVDLTYNRTIRLDTNLPVITSVTRFNDPVPPATEFFAGDVVTFFLMGETGGTAEIELRQDAVTVPIGEASDVGGGNYRLDWTVEAGLPGTWEIRGLLTDVVGNTSIQVSADMVPISDDTVPPITTMTMTTSDPDLADAIGLDDTATFTLSTSSAGGPLTARVQLVPTGGGTAVPVTLNQVLSAGGTTTFSGTLGSPALTEGTYFVDFTVCDDAGFPADCAVGGGCNCRRLAGRTLTVDKTVPAIASFAIGKEVGPGGTADPDFPITVLTVDDVLVVEIESFPVEEGLEAEVLIAGLPTPTVTDLGGGRYEARLTITGAMTEADYDVDVRLTDGVNDSAAEESTIRIDNTPPAAPSVTTSADAAQFPISDGDALTVTATGEAGLVGRVTLGDRVTDGLMEDLGGGTYRYVYTVPSESPGRDQSLAVSVELSDGASRSPAGTGSPVDLDTTQPVVASVELSSDCFGVGTVLTVTIQGSADVPEGVVAIETEGGELLTAAPITIPGTPGSSTYVGSYTFTEDDATRAGTLGTLDYVGRVTLERSDANPSAVVEVSGLTFRTQAPADPDVISVGDEGRYLGDGDLVVAGDVFTLGGDRDPRDEIWARFESNDPVLVDGIDGTDVWSGVVDLAELGVPSGGRLGDVEIELFTVACGLESGGDAYTVVVDTTPPTFGVVQVPDTANPGEDVTVTLTATDDRAGGSLAGRIDVRWVTTDPAPQSTTIAMSRIGDTFTATVPGSAITDNGVSFEIHVNDGGNDTATLRSPQVAFDTMSTARTGSYYEPGGAGEDGISPGQWHMISMPAMLTNASTVAAFSAEGLGAPGGASWRLLRWIPAGGSNGGFVETTGEGPIFFEPGKAYWLHWLRGSRQSFTFEFGPGLTTPLQNAPEDTLFLAAGWNQIGTPYPFPTAWPDGAPVLRGYNPVDDDYSDDAGSTLFPFNGYFVFTASAQEIPLDPFAVPSREAPTNHPAGFHRVPDAWAVRLSLTTGAGVDAENFVAVHPGADDGRDPLDLLRLPVPSEVPELTVSGLESGGEAVDADVRRADPGRVHRWEVRVTSPVAAPGSSLRWSGLSDVPDDVAVAIIDPRGGHELDLREADALPLDLLPGQVTTLVILAGPADEVEASLDAVRAPVPSRLTLSAPVPNPFRAGFRLDFALPAEGPVEAEVFDVHGRRVWRRAEAAATAGAHSWVFDGRTSAGHRLAAGVYFIRVSSGGQDVRRKVVRLDVGTGR